MMGVEHFEWELRRLQRFVVTGPREVLVALDELAGLRVRLMAARDDIARQAAALDRSLNATRAYGAVRHHKGIGR